MVKHVDTAMIMAAGKGTRMMPLTADRPKPLIEVGGVALLDHVLDHVRDAGIGKIVVNVHYRAEQIEQHLAAFAADLELRISDERDVLRDTGGGLVHALPLISDDPFICVNADNWWTNAGENALLQLMAHWDDAHMDVLMLVMPLETAHNSQGIGDFNMDADGRLSRRKGDAPAPFVWTGIQMLSKRLIVDPPSDVFSTNIFWDRAIAQGRCMGILHDGLWFDVGYPAAIAATEAKLAKQYGG
ncbi:MAG: nucleotidyltransferase family protein [Sphingomonadaceae bacterium]|jgi:MurNAc alpha-1-phosphate uridylyltransferase